MYREFARVYDDLMKEIDYNQWAEYLKRIMFNAKEEVKTVLEFGCGTGNITIKLAQKGYQMTAIDLSENMLTVADEKVDKLGLDNIDFYMGDMSSFQIDQKFDAVIACCDTVNYLKTIEDIQSFLYCSLDCLNENGLLMFDINTISKYKKVIADNTFIYNLDNVFCAWENEPEFDKNKVEFNLTFFTKNEKGSYDRYEESQEQYFYSIEEIHHCMKNLGFKNIKYYDFGTFLQGSNEGDRIQVVAEKK